MIITFQIILLCSILLTIMGVIGEKKDINLRNNLTMICIVSILAFVASVVIPQ